MEAQNKYKFPIAKIIFLTGLLGIYLKTRITGLMIFPLFCDEAVYIHYAQILNDNFENLFLTKVNAHKPFFIWIIALYQNYFSDPVIAGRLVSVTAGGVSVIGIYLIGRELFSERVGKVSAIIYLFCPYFIFHERLAMMESLVNAFGIWIIWISFRIAREKEIKKESFILLGLLLGLSFFTKATALAYFPAPFLIFMVWKTYSKKQFSKYLGLTIILVVIINLPYFLADQVIGFYDRNAFFSTYSLYIPFDLLIRFPFEIWGKNLNELYVYLMIYLTFPIVLFATFGAMYALTLKDKKGVTLLLLFVIPAFVIALIGKIIFSRYYLITVPPLIILSGWALVTLVNSISEKKNILGSNQTNIITFVFTFIVVFEGMVFSKNISEDPFKAFFPNIDRYQYLISPISGHGLKEAAEFLIAKSREEPINVMTSWSQGNPQDGIMIYLGKQPQINIIPALWWPDQKKILPQEKTFPVYQSKYQRKIIRIGNTADLKRVFFILPFHAFKFREQFHKNNPEWKLAWSYPTLDGKEHLEIYSLKY